MDIETDVSEGVGVLTINRPASRNALNPAAQYTLIDRFAELSNDPAVRAIVITGAGEEAFCSGGDIKAMAEGAQLRLDQQMADLRRREDIVMMIRTAPQVVVAAINGAATGAGLAIALACDVRVAARSARLGAVHARIGLTGDFGIAWLLHTEVGARHARQLLLDAKLVDAEQAAAIGLVHAVVEDAEIKPEARARARHYARGPGVAYAMIKQNLADAANLSLAETLEGEARRLVLAKQTEDHRNAVTAFAEKRTPTYRGA